MNQPNKTFEESMVRLEQIVRAMERGDVALEESLKLFENGTGIVFYSYETCPWCNRVIPVLDEAAKEAGITVF